MFEPEELMARIVDLEAQLKVSEMAPPSAEQLIACLEGEIAKRDVELERLRAKTRTTMGVGSGDGQLFIHGDYESVKAAQRIVIERDQLRAELSAIKAHGNYAPASVVWIDAHHVIEGNNPSFIKDVALVSAERTSETQIPLARLNATPVQQDQAFCEYRGGNDEEPQDHCMDCTRPVQQVSVPDAAFRNVDQALDLIVGIRHGKNVTQNELWQACELLDAALAAHRAAPAPGGE